jgi:hypothetical protein
MLDMMNWSWHRQDHIQYVGAGHGSRRKCFLGSDRRYPELLITVLTESVHTGHCSKSERILE